MIDWCVCVWLGVCAGGWVDGWCARARVCAWAYVCGQVWVFVAGCVLVCMCGQGACVSVRVVRVQCAAAAAFARACATSVCTGS